MLWKRIKEMEHSFQHPFLDTNFNKLRKTLNSNRTTQYQTISRQSDTTPNQFYQKPAL